jgi:hypothetical protein
MTGRFSSPRKRDGGAHAVDESLFRFLVALEMQKAQRLRYCVSVVCVSAKPEAGELSSPSWLVDLLRGQLRATDAISTWPPASLVLLLIDAEIGDLPAVMRRLTASLAEGSWRAGGVSYPSASLVAEDMVRRAVDLMERATQDPGKHLYLA